LKKNKMNNIKTKDKVIKGFLKDPFNNIPDIISAVNISKEYNIALHPNYLLYWNELKAVELISFLEFLKNIKIKFGKGSSVEYSILPFDDNKKFLEILGVEHSAKKSEKTGKNVIAIDELNTQILFVNMGIDISVDYSVDILKKRIDNIIKFASGNLDLNCVDILNKENFVVIRDKGGTYIGCRMGRPEKSKMRANCQKEVKVHGVFYSKEKKDNIKGLSKKPNNRGIEEDKIK